MDKNIAALLREDAKTVRVTFDQVEAEFPNEEDDTPVYNKAPKQPQRSGAYTYVTHLPVKVNDVVVVDAAGKIVLAFVRKVDTEVKIEPNSGTQYKWVLGVLDMEAYTRDVAEKNAAIEAAVADAYRKGMRRSFAQQVLAGVEGEQRDALQALLGGPKTV